MKKILAIVLVLAFVLSLGSIVLADLQEDSWRVTGWNAFYSKATKTADWVRPIYYDASDSKLYVMTKLESDLTAAGAVYVDNGVSNVFTHLGYTSFNTGEGNQFSRIVGLSDPLRKEHAITVIVNE
jgi:hypothetical protein